MFVVPSRYLFCSEVTGGGPVTLPTEEQLWEICHKDLTMNVFRNGVYGTFRYLPLLSGCFSVIYCHACFYLVLVHKLLFILKINRSFFHKALNVVRGLKDQL